MKRELTLGEFLAVIVVILMSMVGWGVSVEVRLATYKAQIESIAIMSEKIDEIHETVVRHDEKLKNALRTRGSKVKND